MAHGKRQNGPRVGERLMHIALLFIGVLSALAGLATLAYGAANSTAALGPTLIVSGTTALVGGLIVVSLATIVSRIRRLTEALDRQPLPRVAGERFDVGRFAPQDRDLPMQTATATPQVEQETGKVEAVPDVPPPDTHQGVDAELAASAAEPPPVAEDPALPPETKLAEVDGGVTASGAWPGAQPRAEAEAPPKVGQQEDAPVLIPRRERYEPFVPAARGVEAPAGPAVQASPPAREPIILKSGVLDGMAYTLYSDGSIEAELREGTMRFGSIPELRAYMFERTR